MSEILCRQQLWPESLSAYVLTLPTPAENLALDEALLDMVEADPLAATLRFWEPQDYFVVLGRSNRAETEVNLGFCQSEGIPILRRASGGGTVLVGPGCLCYTLALPLTDVHRPLGVSQVTSRLMERTAAGLRAVLPEITVCGTSDLVWRDRKFSGNAQRWLRQSLIHHGTLLYDFDIAMLSRSLLPPTRQPEYRDSRSHFEFVTNISLGSEAIQKVLRSAWGAKVNECPETVLEETRRIMKSRDLNQENSWNLGEYRVS